MADGRVATHDHEIQSRISETLEELIEVLHFLALRLLPALRPVPAQRHVVASVPSRTESDLYPINRDRCPPGGRLQELSQQDPSKESSGKASERRETSNEIQRDGSSRSIYGVFSIVTSPALKRCRRPFVGRMSSKPSSSIPVAVPTMRRSPCSRAMRFPRSTS